jgi:hypothetical protein
MTKDSIFVESLCLFLPIAGGKLPVVEGFSHSLGQCIVGREHLDRNINSDFFISENPHDCKEFSSSLLLRVWAETTLRQAGGLNNELRHTPNHWSTSHPSNELLYKPQQWATSHPSNEHATKPNNELRNTP